MTVSTDAILTYGFAFDEDTRFPWSEDDNESCDEDIEAWWRNVRGFIDLPEPDWTSKAPAAEEAKDKYFQVRRMWEAANPLPVDLVMHCTGDYPMWILSVKATTTKARRGYPEIIDPALFANEPDTTALIEFCREFGIIPPSPAQWYLCSLWW